MMDNDEEDIKHLSELLEQEEEPESNDQLELMGFIEPDTDNENQIQWVIEDGTSPAPDETELFQDEHDLIYQCNDSELRKILLLNRTRYRTLQNTRKKFALLLAKCKQSVMEQNKSIEEVQDTMVQSTIRNNRLMELFKLSPPYFKDQHFFGVPPNSDYFRKEDNCEISPYNFENSNAWFEAECRKLTSSVKYVYNISQQKKISKLIKKFEAKKCGKESKEVDELKKQIEVLKKGPKNDVPKLGEDKDCIDWYKLSQVFFNDKRTGDECRAMWNLYLHPSISKNKWTPEENAKLVKIVQKHSHQNWSAICAELGTNRSEFLTCLHYSRNLNTKFKKKKFTEDEDELLLELIDYYRSGELIPWQLIVAHFENRTRSQLFHRYTYYLSQMHVKKGKFTDAEDVLLITLVERFGRNFRKCAEFMPNRSQVQLKSRYNTSLANSLRKGTITIEDDKQIMAHVEQNSNRNWNTLAKRLCRTSHQLRQRYRIMCKFLAANPGALIAEIPRKQRVLSDKSDIENRFEMLKNYAEKIQKMDPLPGLGRVEALIKEWDLNRAKKVEEIEFTSTKSLDEMLIDCFMEERSQTKSKNGINKAAKEIGTILAVLNVKLSIPVDLRNEHALDNDDKAILSCLNRNLPHTNTNWNLLPASLFSLVGLRNMLYQYEEFKFEVVVKNKSNCELNLEESRAVCADQKRSRDAFGTRFESIFRWPSILSLQAANDGLIGKQYVPKTYVRQKRKGLEQISGDVPRKKLKENHLLVENDGGNNLDVVVDSDEDVAIEDEIKMLSSLLNSESGETTKYVEK